MDPRRGVLIASLPFITRLPMNPLSFPMVDSPIQQGYILDRLAVFEACAAVGASSAAALGERTFPRPQQGGDHITKEWLYALPERNCLYWFGYLLSLINICA